MTAAGRPGYRAHVEVRPPLFQRIRPWQWVLIDAVLALAFTALVEDVTELPHAFLLALGTSLTITLRRRWPVLALGLALLGTAVVGKLAIAAPRRSPAASW